MTKINFNQAMENIRMSPIVAISEAVRKKSPDFKKQTGKDFIHFQRGEIDFPTPSYIIDAAKKALDEGKTKYPKSGGEDKFKEAILKKLEYHNNAFNLNSENIVCTYGGQEALELSFKLFDGKNGAGFAPCWSCVLENFIPYARVNFTEIPLKKDFSVDLDLLDRVLSEISFFYLNTPHNPTGKVFSKSEIYSIAELCHKKNVYLISDEAYEEILFDGQNHFSPISLEYDNIISAFTLSKTYAMTGWRIGYLVSRNKKITELIRLGNYTQTAGLVTFLQYAGAAAFENKLERDKAVNLMRKEFQDRRDLLYEGLKNIPGIEVEKPQGAFYLFPNFSNFVPKNLADEERKLFVFERLMEKGVATVYGSCFGKYFTDNLRFSFSATSKEQIIEGVDRIKETLQSL